MPRKGNVFPGNTSWHGLQSNFRMIIHHTRIMAGSDWMLHVMLHLLDMTPGLMAVQVLNLDFCTLSELPPSLGQLTALTTLDVEGNPYLGENFRPENGPIPPAFPCELSGLQSLKYINLNSCGLTAIPEVRLSADNSRKCLDRQSRA